MEILNNHNIINQGYWEEDEDGTLVLKKGIGVEEVLLVDISSIHYLECDGDEEGIEIYYESI